jgi:hypothetical protein
VRGPRAERAFSRFDAAGGWPDVRTPAADNGPIRIVPVLVFVAAALAPALSVAETEHTDCLLRQQRITTVVLYRTGEHDGKVAVQKSMSALATAG